MASNPNSGFGSKFSGMLSSLFNWVGCYHHSGSGKGQLHHWLAISPDICFWFAVTRGRFGSRAIDFQCEMFLLFLSLTDYCGIIHSVNNEKSAPVGNPIVPVSGLVPSLFEYRHFLLVWPGKRHMYLVLNPPAQARPLTRGPARRTDSPARRAEEPKPMSTPSNNKLHS
jgi:hypothetical protein